MSVCHKVGQCELASMSHLKREMAPVNQITIDNICDRACVRVVIPFSNLDPLIILVYRSGLAAVRNKQGLPTQPWRCVVKIADPRGRRGLLD